MVDLPEGKKLWGFVYSFWEKTWTWWMDRWTACHGV